ncbi:MAG: deoxyribose-phosphate aldolase [Lachnospiraceae bacterium]|nr:deoxyribose-phosphate aldolase [Lachnospiraceae bacterium]MBQ5915789.1 deoxyribose-phosphate aldolase [Lachnospiraceae bacterium]
MTYREVLSKVDHTLLKQQATWEQIKQICDDAAAFGTASICIPPSYVKACAEYLDGKVPVCTVIGFPNGYNTTAVKVFETQEAVKEGAEEIDMVINIGWVKDGRYDLILEEINAIKEACNGKLLKVIIETCLLTEEEKIRMCQVVNESNAEYIKTSTGFSTSGATFEDIALMNANMKEEKMIKAAGGIADFYDAVKFIGLGADRLGTSRLADQIKKGGMDLDAEI